MKEHPILFSAPMVRAILEGRKTQTRRVIKPQPMSTEIKSPLMVKEAIDFFQKITANNCKHIHTSGKGKGLAFPKCPYGLPGDRLWVRETWAPADKILFGSDLDECEAVAYKADGSILDPNGQHFNAFGIDFSKIRWKPSIHMRRDYSRILLEITDIRVERLQDISEADAIAEGVEQNSLSLLFWKHYEKNDWTLTQAKESFRSLWQSINGPESWELNPWVWVIEFKRINP